MEKDLKNILDYLYPKVDYADVRYVENDKETIQSENGMLITYNLLKDRGVGIRVLVNGSWGFASTNKLEKDSLMKTALKAIEVAKASSILKKEDIQLAYEDKHIDTYTTPITKDPFAVSLNKKVELLVKATKMMLKDKVKKAEASLNFYKVQSLFLSSEGSEIKQTIFRSGGGLMASAVDENDFQRRSYPAFFGSRGAANYNTGGYEFIEEMELLENAGRVAEEANQLLVAPIAPSGVMDIVLGGSQLALQVHESAGHALELDRVLGKEVSRAGGSFLTLDKLNSFTYGSPHVNIVADATVPKGMGTFGYDDEGVPARKSYLIKQGKLTGYLMSREDAFKLNLQSNGAARAENWNRIPIVRMTNVNLLPGDYELEELFGGIKQGLFLDTSKSWSIDDQRLSFHFGTEFAQEIKNGRLGKLYKNATYHGITPEFWSSCDGVSNEKYWQLWGMGCGKGQPQQQMSLGHGTSPTRFRNVKVGNYR